MTDVQKTAIALGLPKDTSPEEVALQLCERAADHLMALSGAVMAVTEHLELLSPARMHDFIQGAGQFLESTITPVVDHLAFIHSFPSEWPQSS